MSKPVEKPEASGTMVDILRNVGKGLGALSFVAGILGLVAATIGLILIVAIHEVRIFGYAVLGLGLALLIMSLVTARKTVAGTVTDRRGRYGANTIAMIGLFLTLIAVLNFIAFDAPVRVDVTSTRQFSLAPRTQEVLRDLDIAVNAVAFFDSNDPNQSNALEVVDNMLHEFSVRSEKFSYEIINPQVEPNTARKYSINSFGQVAFIATDSGDFDVADGAFARTPDPNSRQVIVEANEALEQDFVTPLLVITGTEKKTVYFLVGHGEKSLSSMDDNSYLRAVEALRNENYEVRALDLQEQEIVPRAVGYPANDDRNSNEVSPMVIIVAGPQKDMLADEVEALNNYVADGGAMMLLYDTDTPATFNHLLQQWGLGLSTGWIVDHESFVRPDPRTPLVTQHNPAIDITSDLGRTYFPGVRSIEEISVEGALISLSGSNKPVTRKEYGRGQYLSIDLDGREVPLVLVENLLETSGDSWMIADPDRIEPEPDKDLKGPFTTAVVAKVISPIGADVSLDLDDLDVATVIVFGDADFGITDNFDNFSNGDLFLNAVNHLTGDVALINIRPKLIARREMLATPDEFDVIRYTSWLLVPSLMGVGGVVVWWRRR